MDTAKLDRLYEDASLAAAGLEQELSWLEADDTSVSDDRQCRNDFTIRVTAVGATRQQKIQSLKEELQALVSVLERLSAGELASLGRRLAPSARQRGGAEIKRFG